MCGFHKIACKSNGKRARSLRRNCPPRPPRLAALRAAHMVPGQLRPRGKLPELAKSYIMVWCKRETFSSSSFDQPSVSLVTVEGGGGRVGLLGALRAPAKVPQQEILMWEALRPRKRPGQARTVEEVALVRLLTPCRETIEVEWPRMVPQATPHLWWYLPLSLGDRRHEATSTRPRANATNGRWLRILRHREVLVPPPQVSSPTPYYGFCVPSSHTGERGVTYVAWPIRCKLAHAFRWEHSYKRLKAGPTSAGDRRRVRWVRVYELRPGCTSV